VHGSYNLSQIFGKVRFGEGCRFSFMLYVFDEWFVGSFCVRPCMEPEPR